MAKYNEKDISNSSRRDLTDNHHDQIKAWIWETAVKLGFQDICERIDAAYNLQDLIKKYFNWGRSSKFLHYVYELQKIIVKVEIQKWQFELLYSLQKLSLNILTDSHCQLDADIVTELICVHHSASLLIFAKTGKLEIKQSSCLPTKASDWLKVKQIIGFKDDRYQQEYIQAAKLVQDCKRAILKKNLSKADYAKSLLSLVPKLRHITFKLIGWLPPPTLIHFSKLEARKELQILNSPLHILVLKHIEGGVITRQSLHSLLDELQDLSPNYLSDEFVSLTGENPSMKSRTTTVNSRSNSQNKRMLVVPKSSGNHNLPTPDHSSSHKRCSDSDILVIKGVAWDLREGHSTEGQNKLSIQSRAVIDIIQDGHSPLRDDPMPISARGHEQNDVIEIHLEPRAKTCLSGVDPIRKVSEDLDSMGELIKNAKMLVAELEIRYKRLKAHKDDLIKKSNGNDVRNHKEIGVSTQSGFDDSESPILELFCDSDKPLNSTPKDTSERTVRWTHHDQVSLDEIMPSADILPSAKVASNHSAVSVSKETVPLHLFGHSLKQFSPQVKLTPIKQSLIDKYSVNPPASLSCHLTTPENKKLTKKRKSRESSSNNESPRNGSFSHFKAMQSSLSKIDLRVTEQHSSTESDVVVLESGKSPSSPFTCKVTPNKEAITSSSDSISKTHQSTKTLKTTHLATVNAVNLNSSLPKKQSTVNKSLKSRHSRNNFNNNNKVKKKNLNKKSGKTPFIVTSSLWRSKIFSSSNSSGTSSGESLSFNSPVSSLSQVSTPLSKTNNTTDSNQNSKTKQDHHCNASLSPPESCMEFFTPEQSPLQTLSKSSVQINSPFELDAGIYSTQKLSKIKKSIKKCEVPLKLKKINMRWGVVDIYS